MDFERKIARIQQCCDHFTLDFATHLAKCTINWLRTERKWPATIYGGALRALFAFMRRILHHHGNSGWFFFQNFFYELESVYESVWHTAVSLLYLFSEFIVFPVCLLFSIIFGEQSFQPSLFVFARACMCTSICSILPKFANGGGGVEGTGRRALLLCRIIWHYLLEGTHRTHEAHTHTQRQLCCRE